MSEAVAKTQTSDPRQAAVEHAVKVKALSRLALEIASVRL